MKYQIVRYKTESEVTLKNQFEIRRSAIALLR